MFSGRRCGGLTTDVLVKIQTEGRRAENAEHAHRRTDEISEHQIRGLFFRKRVDAT